MPTSTLNYKINITIMTANTFYVKVHKICLHIEMTGKSALHVANINTNFQ